MWLSNFVSYLAPLWEQFPWVGEAVFVNGGVDLLDDCAFRDVACLEGLNVVVILLSGFSDLGGRYVG
jgi:hypothetical protein